jgi:hypothetical protein
MEEGVGRMSLICPHCHQPFALTAVTLPPPAAMSRPGIPAAVAAQREEFVFSAPATPVQWFCPIHRKSVIKPAGTSKSSGKPYGAFWSCPEKVGNAWCDQKPPKGFPVPHAEPIAPVADPSPFPPMDLDEMPF